MSIEVKKLCFAYKEQVARPSWPCLHGLEARATVLKDINFRLEQGGFLSIVGPNGAGKTTLLNLLCGLLKPASGTISIDSSPLQSYSVKQLAGKIAVVRQEFIPVFEFTAAQVVSMARTSYLGVLAFETDADRKAVAEAFEVTDTARFADRPLNHLSGGERQLIFIARALAQQTPILLLDEPTSFLDMRHQVVIFDLLKKMQIEKQKTVVAVTHDVNLASRYSDTILLLAADGGYTFGPTQEILSAERIESVFNVKTSSFQIGKSRFFFPLGKYPSDRHG